MKVLSAHESSAWLKRRKLKARSSANDLCVAFPEERHAQEVFASALAGITDWSSGVVVLDRPGMPHEQALVDVCGLHAEYGHQSTPGDIQMGTWPGHLLDDDKAQNSRNVERLLRAMVSGYLEGVVAKKSGRFAIFVDCGRVRLLIGEKSLSGRVREMLRDGKLKAFA